MIEKLRQRLTPEARERVSSGLRPEGHELARTLLQPLTEGQGPLKEEAIRAEIEADPDAVLQAAGTLMQNRVSLLGGYPVQELGAPFDWYRAPRDDWQWPTHLSRHRYLTPLALAYRHTGDQRYAQKIVDVLVDWAEKFPLGAPGCDWRWKVPLDDPREPSGEGVFTGYVDGPWTSLSAHTRVESWSMLFQLIWDAPSMTNAAVARLLISLWTDHLRLMYDFPRTRNQFQGISVSLIHLGWFYPLFQDAGEAETVGWERLEQYARGEIYPDGSVAECSPNYGLGCLRRMYDTVAEARYRGRTIPPIMTERIAKAVRYFALTSDPAGCSPRIAKGGGDVRPQLEAMNATVGDPDVQYIASGGTEGQAPPPCVSFPWTGHHVMRSGWDLEATWLFFESGPRGSGHHDMAQNNIQLISGGQWLLADPGYFSYSNSGPDGDMARYLKSTAAHNSALVNGLGQLSFAPGTRLMANSQAGTYHWHEDEETAFAEGTYANGYGPDGAVDVHHRRQVTYHKHEDRFTILDQFSGSGETDAWLHWQIPSEADISVTGETIQIRIGNRTLHMTFDSDSGVELSQFRGQKDPLLGWFSKHYGQLEPTPLLRVATRGTLPLQVTTRLVIEHLNHTG